MNLEFSQQNFEKYSHIKFLESPSSVSRVVPCGRTDMTKLIVAFRNFANPPDNYLPKDAKHLVFIAETVFTVRNELDCYEVFNSL